MQDLQFFICSTSNIQQGSFPILRCDHGEFITTSGLSLISQHLRSCPHVTHRPEDSLSPIELADIIAWTHFIRSKCRQLLDLYLYVSTENYYGATKPTWTKLLPWSSKFIVPPAERQRAKNRTAHLGMSGLDLDEVEKAKSEGGEGIMNQGASATLINQQRRLRNLLRQPEYVDSFKLNALIDQFCSPFEEQIGMQNWLVTDGEHPTSVDCVLAGYLMVMLHADVPKRWLRNAIEKRSHQLRAWEKRMQTVLARGLEGVQFRTAEKPTLIHGFSFVGNHLLKLIPLFDRPEILRVPGSVSALERQQRSKSVFEKFKILQILTVTVGALGITGLSVLGYLQWHSKRDGDYAITASPRNRTLADFGEAGEFLSVFGNRMAFGAITEAERAVGRQRENLDDDGQKVRVAESVPVAGKGNHSY
jgi:hypothetical protein